MVAKIMSVTSSSKWEDVPGTATYKVFLANVDPLAILLHAQLLFLGHRLYSCCIVIISRLRQIGKTETGTDHGHKEGKTEKEQRSTSNLRCQPRQDRVGLAQRFRFEGRHLEVSAILARP